MTLAIDRDSSTPIYLQISRQLRQAIVDGEQPFGSRLLPERRLAKLLGVNRTTVVNAYRELAADGLVAGHVGRGTVVVYEPSNADEPSYRPISIAEHDLDAQATWPRRHTEPPRRHPDAIHWDQVLTSVTDVMDDPLLRDAMTASARPEVIRFATGTPAPELYPVDAIRAIFDEALNDAGSTLLQHTPTEGYYPLREELARWMLDHARGTGAAASLDASNVCVVAGSQQGLYLLANTLIEPGDVLAIEAPTYLGAAQVFRAAGARLLPIPVDQDGMQVDILADVIQRRRPKAIYTLPTFQNPSGTVMSMGRRLRLLDLAARYQIPIIEDDPYGALRYDGRPLPSLFALDRAAGRENVIYLSTVSKMLFPGFRIGWISAARPVVERVTLMKQLVDLDTNQLAQRVVWTFFNRGLLHEHLQQVAPVYAGRRDRMLRQLEEHIGPALSTRRPEGGFYLWCRLEDGLRARDLLPEAARQGVIFAPGESFHTDSRHGKGRFDIRLNFTLPNDAEIDEGVQRLARAIQELAGQMRTQDHAGLRQLTPIV